MPSHIYINSVQLSLVFINGFCSVVKPVIQRWNLTLPVVYRLLKCKSILKDKKLISQVSTPSLHCVPVNWALQSRQHHQSLSSKNVGCSVASSPVTNILSAAAILVLLEPDFGLENSCNKKSHMWCSKGKHHNQDIWYQKCPHTKQILHCCTTLLAP